MNVLVLESHAYVWGAILGRIIAYVLILYGTYWLGGRPRTDIWSKGLYAFACIVALYAFVKLMLLLGGAILYFLFLS